MTAARQLSIFDAAPQPIAKPVYVTPPPPPPAPDSSVPLQSVAPAPTPLPPKSGRQLRDEAIQQVEANADAGWMERAENALRELCCERGRESLTTDDIWRLLGDDEPREPRAMGAVLRRGCALGIIESTDRMEPSMRAKQHGRKIQIWRVS